MTHFFDKTALKAFLCDCIGATGVLLLLVAGFAHAQGGTPTYVTCKTETVGDGAKVCTDATSGQTCASGKTCVTSANNGGCVCR